MDSQAKFLQMIKSNDDFRSFFFFTNFTRLLYFLEMLHIYVDFFIVGIIFCSCFVFLFMYSETHFKFVVFIAVLLETKWKEKSEKHVI